MFLDLAKRNTANTDEWDWEKKKGILIPLSSIRLEVDAKPPLYSIEQTSKEKASIFLT